MGTPEIPARNPVVGEVEAGEYYWCACGKSSNQPYCDGSHKDGTDFTPVKFVLEEKKKVALCQCKHTKTPPYCDGSHKDL